MITSFFKTSKPIHYIIFLIVLICLFVYQRFVIVSFEGSLLNTLSEIGHLLILLASFFTLIFIVTKNNLTYNNGFAALYFCLFIGLIPSCLEVNSILVSNLFIVLSLRRIMSLKTKSNIKKKLFDASMWICLAAIFEPWAILFFLVLFSAMVIYSVTQIKNTIVPFCGILAVAILLICYRLLTENSLPSVSEFLPNLSFDNISFNNTIIETKSLQFLAVVLFGIVSLFGKAVFKNRLKTSNMFVIILATLIGITIVFISSNNRISSHYLFAFAPASIILANFSETIIYRWLSDLVIGLLLFTVLIQLGLNIFSLIN
jgi:hypothetical protein